MAEWIFEIDNFASKAGVAILSIHKQMGIIRRELKKKENAPILLKIDESFKAWHEL